jgi:hypothetical protein
MSRRNRVSKFLVWEGLDSASPSPSTATTTDQVDVVKYILTIDSTVVCDLLVQFTDDPQDFNETWHDFDFGSTISLDGSVDTEYTIYLNKPSAKKTRLNLSNNSGTGLITAYYSSSQVGA